MRSRLWVLSVLGGAVLLGAVLVPGVGRAINGSKRWLSLGIVNLQPSEFMKLFVVLYASSYAVRRAAFRQQFAGRGPRRRR